MSNITNDNFIDSIRDSGNYDKAVEFGFITKQEKERLEQAEYLDKILFTPLSEKIKNYGRKN